MSASLRRKSARTRMEDSPSPVYGAALLMRFGSDPIRGSNPRSSAQLTFRFQPGFRQLRSGGNRPGALRGDVDSRAVAVVPLLRVAHRRDGVAVLVQHPGDL